ncbi:MAG: NUDIX hydrolase [Firmicutes bacterium]|nr:NUDIX hydrolase [Bacillota bacterium]
MKRMYPEQPVAAVAAVILRPSKGSGTRKILLIKRGIEPAVGKWSIPGGAIELGEAARDAVRREVKEECGLDITVLDVFEIFDVFVRDNAGALKFHYVIIDFLAEPEGGSLEAGSDVSDATWVTLGEAANLDITRGTREVLRRLAERGLM